GRARSARAPHRRPRLASASPSAPAKRRSSFRSDRHMFVVDYHEHTTSLTTRLVNRPAFVFAVAERGADAVLLEVVIAGAVCVRHEAGAVQPEAVLRVVAERHAEEARLSVGPRGDARAV